MHSCRKFWFTSTVFHAFKYETEISDPAGCLIILVSFVKPAPAEAYLLTKEPYRSVEP